MLTFKDFPPAVLKAPGFLSAGAYEDLAGLARTADQWLKENGVRPLNVETLLIPSQGAGVTGSPVTHIARDFNITWMQVVRVWYETK